MIREYSLLDLLKRPELEYKDLASLKGEPVDNPQVSEQVQIQVKYAGYITRQQDDIEKLRRHENTVLPDDLNYDIIEGMSKEIRQKLSEQRPETLAAAGRVPGVTPAAVSLLLIHLKKRAMATNSELTSASSSTSKTLS